jgi:hypothetical protein
VSTANERLIAACGLDCTDCEIRLVPFDAEIAQGVAAWFKERGWLEESEGVAEILERKMYCKGCHGDRSLHWSPDCWILQCCVNQHGLQHCSECRDFPCERLVEWAGQNEGYAQALERLQGMRAEGRP